MIPSDSVKVSALPGLSLSESTDVLPIVQDGVTYNVTPGQLTSVDWKGIPYIPASVVYEGGRVYTLTFTGVDITGFITSAAKVRTERSVPAPIQSSLLNGTTQYWSRSSPGKINFTDDGVVSAYIKIPNYPAAGAIYVIASMFNGTSGWDLEINETGQILFVGYNAGAGNYSYVASRNSAPINEWVNITAQLDMSSFSATTTTSYVMFDGVDMPSTVSRSGSLPTSLIQAGSLEIGSRNGGLGKFTGNIAQVAIFNAKVPQATMRTYLSQGLSGSEANLASAYSFSNSANDLNTTTPNNLSPNGSVLATANSSPFGRQSNGSSNQLLDYGVVLSTSFTTDSTMKIRVPNGCMIPTVGVINDLSYSALHTPFGMPQVTPLLGRAEIRPPFTTASTSPTQVPGLTTTVYVSDSIETIEVKGFAIATSSSSSAGIFITLWEGTVGSGREILRLELDQSTANFQVGGLFSVDIPASPGVKTYNVGFHVTGGTGSFGFLTGGVNNRTSYISVKELAS